jgi:hypothetical protein
MNERIKQLAKEAGFNPYNYEGGNSELFEKFTELLIKECSKAIESWKKEPFPFDEDLAVQLIHEHFGFEIPPKNIKVIKI